jgi:hypothetical protein
MLMRLLLSTLSLAFSATCFSQSIGTFSSVAPTAQTGTLVIPSTHTFQRIIRSGDLLSPGVTLGNNLDFSGYVPIAGSSTNGYLSISSETFPAEAAILNMTYGAGTHLWSFGSAGKVSFPVPDLGQVRTFCAGTVTPDNHVMVCEEVMSTSLDDNSDGYIDDGWIVEFDPATRTVIDQDNNGTKDKLWAMGRAKHEDVAINAAKTVAYWSADDPTYGYVYKFVPTVAGNFSAGLLYVLVTTGALGTGTWQLVANTTKAERNNTSTLAQAAGAYNFVRLEGLEIGPDGKVYFAATTSGNIYRFRDQGTTVDQLEVFVASTSYDVDGAGPYTPEPWGQGADNIAFDGDGNLWVLQDGDRNHIWVVGASHTAAVPNVRLFATTPQGSEPTGITFSPDYKFLFISLQNPDGSNSLAQTDAAGQSVVFNTSTTLVIARKEFLGPGVLPLKFTSFDATATAAGALLSWSVTDVQQHKSFGIERSDNGRNFQQIGTNNQSIADGSSVRLQFIDKELPGSGNVYYRIRQTDLDGKISYSEIRKLEKIKNSGKLIVHQSAGRLSASYTATSAGMVHFSIINESGALIWQEDKFMNPGSNTLSFTGSALKPGVYFLVAEGNVKKFMIYDLRY